MSSIEDQFLTGSIDEGIRLWDIKQPEAINSINFQAGRPCVGYDPSGLVFAIGLQIDKTVQLYDGRKLGQSPFDTFKIDDMVRNGQPSPPPEWTGLKFSNDGQNILLTTSGDVHYLIDAFNGKLKKRLIGHVGLNNASMYLGGEKTSFTPDGRYLISGSRDGRIHIWDITPSLITSTATSESIDIKPIHTLIHHTRTTQAVRFNPTKLLMVSACTDLAFWLPNLDLENTESEDKDIKSNDMASDNASGIQTILATDNSQSGDIASETTKSLLESLHYHLY